MSGGGGVLGGPKPYWKSPQPRRAAIQTRNTYVGSMKTVPLSRMPRRLIKVISTTTATPISALIGSSCGYADVRALTPAATETATVSVYDVKREPAAARPGK